jgi:zinc transporter ZupT
MIVHEGATDMQPAYWIGIMALVGAIAGYAIFKLTGWLDSGVGTAVGILIGVIIYTNLTEKEKEKHT